MGNNEVSNFYIIEVPVNIISIFDCKSQLQRMKQEASSHQKKVNSLEEDLSLARRTCEAWRTKAIIAEQQRDEVYYILQKNIRDQDYF